MEDDFRVRIRHIAQLLAFEQDVSSYDPLEVVAARIYLKDQGSSNEQVVEQDSTEISGPESYS